MVDGARGTSLIVDLLMLGVVDGARTLIVDLLSTLRTLFLKNEKL